MRKIDNIVKDHNRTAKEVAYLLFEDFNYKIHPEIMGTGLAKKEFNIVDMTADLTSEGWAAFRKYHTVFVHMVSCYEYTTGLSNKFMNGFNSLKWKIDGAAVGVLAADFKDSVPPELYSGLSKRAFDIEKAYEYNKLDLAYVGNYGTRPDFFCMLDALAAIEASNCFMEEVFNHLKLGRFENFLTVTDAYYDFMETINEKSKELHGIIKDEKLKAMAAAAFPIYDYGDACLKPNRKDVISFKRELITNVESATKIFVKQINDMKALINF